MNTTLTNIPKHSYILVTGGFGFIGSRIVERLNRLGFYNIYIVDDLNPYNQRLASKLRFKGTISREDFYIFLDSDGVICSFNNMEGINMSLFDIVFHFGAVSSTSGAFSDCYLWNLNFSNLLAKKFKNYYTKVVFASSAAIYGNGNDFSDDHEKLYEVSKGNSNYAISKSMMEKYLYENDYFYTKNKDKQNIVVRPFNVFGPNEHFKQNMASYAFQCFKKAYLNRAKINFDNKLGVFRFNNAIPSRDFIHVDDVIDKIFALTNGENSGIFNIGNGCNIDWFSYTEIIKNKLNDLFDQKYQILEWYKEGFPKGYQTYTLSNNTKVNAAIGSKNKTFEEVKADIENYLDWLYNNSSYYLD